MADETSDSSVYSSDLSDLSCDSDDFEHEIDPEIDADVHTAVHGTKPYQFEPEVSDESDESQSDTEPASEDLGLSRLFSTDWCQCGQCQTMATIRESCCCHEILEMATLLKSDNVDCITEHPAFSAVCLNIYVLQTCYKWHHQQYKKTVDNINERYRYTSYRMLVRFVWGWLGKSIRVTLPACAVSRIRKEFPSADGRYTGYTD